MMPRKKANTNGDGHANSNGHGHTKYYGRGRHNTTDCRIAKKLVEHWIGKEGLPGLEDAEQKFAELAQAIGESPADIRKFLGRHATGYLRRLTGACSMTVQASWQN